MAGKGDPTFMNADGTDRQDPNVSPQFVATTFDLAVIEKPISESLSNVTHHETDSREENLLIRSEAAQTIFRMGYFPTIIQRAMNRMVMNQEGQITADSILDEIDRLRQDESIPDSKLKRPVNADNMKNERIPQGLVELQRENLRLRQIFLCKACEMVDVTHVILSCCHMICEACLQELKICWCCKCCIGDVQKVRFAK